jgi:hypothetical protein
MISTLGSYGMASPLRLFISHSILSCAGDEFILDCRVMEISRAIEKRPSHLIQIEATFDPQEHQEEVRLCLSLSLSLSLCLYLC